MFKHRHSNAWECCHWIRLYFKINKYWHKTFFFLLIWETMKNTWICCRMWDILAEGVVVTQVPMVPRQSYKMGTIGDYPFCLTVVPRQSYKSTQTYIHVGVEIAWVPLGYFECTKVQHVFEEAWYLAAGLVLHTWFKTVGVISGLNNNYNNILNSKRNVVILNRRHNSTTRDLHVSFSGNMQSNIILNHYLCLKILYGDGMRLKWFSTHPVCKRPCWYLVFIRRLCCCSSIHLVVMTFYFIMLYSLWSFQSCFAQ